MRYLAALLVLLALQFVPGVGSGDARAACVQQSGNTWINCSGAQEAYEKAAELAAPYANDAFLAGYCPPPRTPARVAVVVTIANKTAQGYVLTPSDCGTPVSLATWLGDACPSGSTWNDTMHTCFDPAICQTLAPLGATIVSSASNWSTACSQGCEFEQNAGVGVQWFDESTSEWKGFTTGWEPSGDACPSGAPSAQAFSQAQECRPAPTGQTFCIKPTGEHCYSVTNGSDKQICWRPGETGEKATGNALQVRNGGTVAADPITSPGDQLAASGEPVTATSKVNNTNVTTTTTNYTTINGTDVGGTDAGEPGDGSGSGGQGEGDDPFGCEGCDMDDGSAAHAGDSIWGADETASFTPDESGLGFSRSCPAPLALASLGGAEISFSSICEILGWIGLLVLAMAHAHALYIFVGD